jgi:Family of unknown function (DUF5681)
MAQNRRGTNPNSLSNLEKGKWKKGQSGNPAGSVRKFTTVLKAQGYKLSEINDTLQVMLSMTSDEIVSVFKNENATVLEKTIAAAIVKGIQKGTMSEIETILTRAFGAPVSTNKMVGANGETVQLPTLILYEQKTIDALKKIATKKPSQD